LHGRNYAPEQFELKDDRAAVAAGGGTLRVSLTSNCSGATLRHEINDRIRLTSVPYGLSQYRTLKTCAPRIKAKRRAVNILFAIRTLAIGQPADDAERSKRRRRSQQGGFPMSRLFRLLAMFA